MMRRRPKGVEMTSENGRVRFTLNGESVDVSPDHPHLLAALREELEVLSPKDGCAPMGQCGSCTVLLDGKARIACSTSLERIADAEITTLEGFEEADRDRLARAFAVTGALQCGFCIPGILVRVQALLDKKGSSLTGAAAAPQLGAHLCRCTGYTKIFEAVDMLASGQIPVPELPGRCWQAGGEVRGNRSRSRRSSLHRRYASSRTAARRGEARRPR